MERALDKHRILDAAILQHETVIKDFHARIKEMMVNSGNVNEEEYDIQVQSLRAENAARVNGLSEQLEFANRELELLLRMKSELGGIHDVVQRGSVVNTDKKTFFVSASIERFEMDGIPFFGLSVLSPLYQIMKGKRAGDIFSYGKTKYTILDVF